MADAPTFELAEAPAKRPFLGANTRSPDGSALFPEVGSQMIVTVESIEAFHKDGDQQPAFILTTADGTEYIKPLGKTNQYQLGALGLKTANEAVGWNLVFESYDTGSTGAFKFGLKIVDGAAVGKK